MTSKPRTIVLEHIVNLDGHEDQFRVQKVTDSTEYLPSGPKSLLSRKEVDALCMASGWKVTIVPRSY